MACYKRGWVRRQVSRFTQTCQENTNYVITVSIGYSLFPIFHDDVIKWIHLPRYWPFVWGIHPSLVNSQHKGQWREALTFSLICAWIHGWVNNGEASDLRRHRAHYDVIVMHVKHCQRLISFRFPYFLATMHLWSPCVLETPEIYPLVSDRPLSKFILVAINCGFQLIESLNKIWIRNYGNQHEKYYHNFWYLKVSNR